MLILVVIKDLRKRKTDPVLLSTIAEIFNSHQHVSKPGIYFKDVHRTNYCHIHSLARHQRGPGTGGRWHSVGVLGNECQGGDTAAREAALQQWVSQWVANHSGSAVFSECGGHCGQEAVQCSARVRLTYVHVCVCVAPDTTKECVRVCALVCCASVSVRQHLVLLTGIILYLFTCEWVGSAGDRRDARWLAPHSCNLLTHNAI